MLATLVLLAGCAGGVETIEQHGPLLDPRQVETIASVVTPMAGLNTTANEFGATMPLDTSVIFFTSSRGEGLQRIYIARAGGGGWQAPEPVVVINNGQDNGLPSITPGGEILYFTGDEYGFGDCDLYAVEVGPRGAVPSYQVPWSVPSNLGLSINTGSWESGACLSADGSLLYFSSDRPGGYGGRDIWVSRRGRDGSWEEPINAGQPINTEFDEITPWLAPDNKTLLFSSNGHPGLGGFDLFMVTEMAGYQVIRHLGQPINGPSDDICFSLSADGSHAFLSSNRAGGSGGYDLYRVSPVPIIVDPLMVASGRVYDAQGAPIIATIDVTDLTTDIPLGRFRTDAETGYYHAVLPRAYDYALTATAPEHLFSSEQITVPADLERDTATRIDFRLRPITGTVRLLVFFRTNESVLLKQSTADLDRLVTFLAANPTVRVEIAGHTDASGDPKAGLALSRERAQAVRSFLIANRIPAERVTAIGYGSTQPIADNATEEGRAMNRRVEMRIVTE